jgi:ABC-type molybdate transport system substrate-binding protein
MSARPDAASFAAYLRGPGGRKLFEKYGFTVLDPER